MRDKTPLSSAQHPCNRSCQPARDAPEKGSWGLLGEQEAALPQMLGS